MNNGLLKISQIESYKNRAFVKDDLSLDQIKSRLVKKFTLTTQILANKEILGLSE